MVGRRSCRCPARSPPGGDVEVVDFGPRPGRPRSSPCWTSCAAELGRYEVDEFGFDPEGSATTS